MYVIEHCPTEGSLYYTLNKNDMGCNDLYYETYYSIGHVDKFTEAELDKFGVLNWLKDIESK